MAEPAIIVSEVSKTFKLPHEKHTSIKSMFVNFFRGHRTFERQKVLQNVSLEIQQGEFFGIIGRNGNGKSTLLKLLAGIYSPDKGSIAINGKLTPFIELGVGFNPELTGRENVFLNGALLGFSQKEMEVMYEDIVNFAELEKFMDQKLKNYSSGMQVRLAFSIAIRAKSDILLIDEVLAVGDVNFQKKCIEVFERLKQEGRTIVFVSHSMGYIRDFCDRVAVINKGKLAFIGNAEKGIDLYNKINSEDESQRVAAENTKSGSSIERFGTGGATINSYKVFNSKGIETSHLESNKKFSIELSILFNEAVTNPAVGIMFRKNPQENLFGINNFYQKKQIGSYKKGDILNIRAQGIMPLSAGIYHMSFSVAEVRTESDYTELDNLNNILKVDVGGKPYWGTIAADIAMEVVK